MYKTRKSSIKDYLVMTLAAIGITGGFALFLALILLGPILGALLWPYTVNAWLVYTGKEPVFLWWYGALLGFLPFLNPIIIVGSIGTFIAMMFLT